MANFSSLSPELIFLIVEHLYLAKGAYCTKNLAVSDRRTNVICREFLFKKVTVNQADDPTGQTLDHLDFLITQPSLCSVIHILNIAFSGKLRRSFDENWIPSFNARGPRPAHGSHEVVERLSRLLPLLIHLREIRIGGDRYCYLYEPCLLDIWTPLNISMLAKLDPNILLSLDCYQRYKDESIDLTKFRQLKSLRVCAFDDDSWRTWSNIAVMLPTHPLYRKGDNLPTDLSQTVKNNSQLCQLHFMYHRPIWRPLAKTPDNETAALIQQCGQAAASSSITSLTLDGNFRHEFAAQWDSWAPCFDKIKSMSCSHRATICALTARFPNSFQALKELRLSILNSGFSFGHRTVCYYGVEDLSNCVGHLAEDRSADNFLLHVLSNLRLKILSLCGFEKSFLKHALRSCGPTLRSLRFYVSAESPRLQDIELRDLQIIRESCPQLQWLGVSIPKDDLVVNTPPWGILAHNYLDELAKCCSLCQLSLFVPGHNGKDWNISDLEVVDIYTYLQREKVGRTLKWLKIECNNHVWKLEELGPSRVLVRSMSREVIDHWYALEVWDLDGVVPVVIPEMTQIICDNAEPEYEWGLTKWELIAEKPPKIEGGG